MNFEYSEQSKQLQSKLNAFINEHLIPLEGEFLDFQKRSHNRWKRWPKIEVLKQKAKQAGLRTLFLPKH